MFNGFAVLFLVILYADECAGLKDPGLFRIRQISVDNGAEHSFPAFSIDGRTIHFTAKGGGFGKCRHVFRLDLNENATAPISLFSTGFGHEQNAQLMGELFAVESTAIQALKSATATETEAAELSEESLCEKSVCDGAEDAELKRACSQPHIERRLHSSVIRPFFCGVVLTTHGTEDLRKDGWLSNEAFHTDDGIISQRIYAFKAPDTAGENIRFECKVEEDGKQRTDRRIVKTPPGTYGSFRFHCPPEEHTADHRVVFVGIDNSAVPKSLLSKGIIPLHRAKLYKSTFKELRDPKTPPTLWISDPQFGFADPSFNHRTGDILATRIDKTGNRAIVRIDQNGKIEVLSDVSVDSYHPTVSEDGKSVVFVSNRDGGSRIFLAELDEENTTERGRKFPTLPFVATPQPTGFFNQTRTLSALGGFDVAVSPKLSRDGNWLMYAMGYADAPCQQIFQLRLSDGDTTLTRKMTSGMHHFSSPNFLGPNDEAGILYSATLTKAPNPDGSLSACVVNPCDPLSPTRWSDKQLQFLCEKPAAPREMPAESELYIADRFGLVKRRLTNNQYFDGEANVSPDFRSVVFTSGADGDYELYRMQIDGDAKPEKLTAALGYEGAAVHSPDGRLISFIAWRPSTDRDTERYGDMRSRHFTDLSQTDIYLLELGSNEEIRVTVDCRRCYAPTFVPNSQMILYINETKDEAKQLWAFEWFEEEGKIRIQEPKPLDDLRHCIREMSFGPTTKDFVYVGMAMSKIYEITLAEFDATHENSAMGAFAGFPFIMIAYFILKMILE